jgi:hypothetical protein
MIPLFATPAMTAQSGLVLSDRRSRAFPNLGMASVGGWRGVVVVTVTTTGQGGEQGKKKSQDR